MKYHQHCPICSNEEITILKAYEAKKLVSCKACKLVFDHRVPDDITLHNHYEQYDRDDYLSPITKKRYQELLRSFNKYKGNKRILDIGSGIGFFLNTAKKKGWDVYGTEFTDDAISICERKGIKMFKGSIESIDFGDLKFDVVTSFELIEHLSMPNQHFKAVERLLKPNGLYYLTTPNFNSLNSRLLKKEWNVITFPEHLMYFTRRSVKKGLSNAGFKVVKNQTSGLSPGRFLKSKNNALMDFSDRTATDEKIRENIEKNAGLRLLKRWANSLLSFLGLGESIKVWAIKS